MRVLGMGLHGEKWDFEGNKDEVRNWVKFNLKNISNVMIFDCTDFNNSENNYYISRRCGWKKIKGEWIFLDYGWRWEVNGKFWKNIKE